METWKQANLPSQVTVEMTPAEVENKKSDTQVVDVRSLEEWKMGHIAGAKHLPCSELPSRMDDLPDGKLIFVCAGGYRSILAASYARRSGQREVAHVPGGVHAWQGAGLELVLS